MADSNQKITSDTVGASFGLGTLCVAFADSLDPSSAWRSVLLFGAPTVTLVSGWIWATAKNLIFMSIENFNSQRAFKNAQHLLAAAQERGAADDHIAALQQGLNGLEQQRMDKIRRRANFDLEND